VGSPQLVVIDQTKTFSMSEEEGMHYVTILQDKANYFAVSQGPPRSVLFQCPLICGGHGINKNGVRCSLRVSERPLGGKSILA
jgi:hypothetical protein